MSDSKRVRLSAVFSRTTLYVVLSVVTALVLFPVYWTLNTSLKPEKMIFVSPPQWIPIPFSAQSYIFLFSQTQFPLYFVNSFVVSVAAVVTTLLIGTMASFRFARGRFPLKNFLMFVFLATMMIPGLANLIPLYEIVRELGIMNTRLSVLMLFTAGFLPLVIWLMRGFIESIPVELDESARIDGCTTVGIFTKVILPLLGPGLSAAATVVFIYSWNDFIIPLTFIHSNSKTMIQVAVRTFVGYYSIHWTRIMASCMFATVPPIVLFLFFQRRLVAGLTAGAIKG